MGWSVASRLRDTFELQDPQHARLLPMEGLRGVAVTLVFLQHYTVQAQQIGLPPGFTAWFAAAFRSYGNLGVELFFVLSGYLIYGSLVRSRPPFLAFMARRYQRIYPAFLVVFLLALPIAYASPSASKVPEGAWPAAVYFAANLSLVAGLVPMPRVVDVAWSLSYEMFFYVATAALVLGLGLGLASARVRIGVILAMGTAFIGLALAGVPWLPIRMLPFFAGMLLAEGLGKSVPAWLAWAAPAAAFSLSVSHLLGDVSGEFVHTAAFFLLCAVCFRDAGLISRCMVWAPLRWLGNMSYSYYLVHGFVVRIAMLLLGRLLAHGMPEWLFWAYIPLVFAATLAGSAVLFIAVEKPLSLQPKVRPVPEAVSVSPGLP